MSVFMANAHNVLISLVWQVLMILKKKAGMHIPPLNKNEEKALTCSAG
jgi:hypothetical protein